MSENLNERDTHCQQALRNIDGIISLDSRFPNNVFLGKWGRFLFFDPDRIFEEEFLIAVRALADAEGGLCICFCDLYRSSIEVPEERSFLFLDRTTTTDNYISFLVEQGWIFRMDRFCLTSNVAGWAMYTERDMEFAVLAIRDSETMRRAVPAIERLRACPIEEAVKEPPSYGLSAKGLKPEWRQALLTNYTTPV